MNRRVFFGSAAAPLLRAQKQEERYVADWEKPLFNLRGILKSPVKIKSVELLKNGRDYFVRTTSTDGVEGITMTKQVGDYVPILLRLVAPAFIGKDARDVESLVDAVYQANYKMAGQPFWCPVAYVEQSIFDLLGKVAAKPVGALLGGVVRQEIPVYLSGSGRELKAEQEVEVYRRGVEATNTQAVKFKIGGRMSRNLDAYPGRTETMMKLARKVLGDKVVLYADANGSYNSAKAIQVGRMLEELKCDFFEEPCPWEEKLETKRVADALKIPVAAGEQDSSLPLFQWMIDNKMMDIVQFDLNYNGGLTRGCRVARMARAAGMQVVPHNTQTGAAAVYMLHFASATPNIGPFMEYPWRAPEKADSRVSPNPRIENGKVKVPTGPGFGLQFDPDFLKKAVKVETC